MTHLTGQCLCGAVAYQVEGGLGTVVNCHCSKCRRWHGAAFRTRAAVESKNFKWVRGEEHISKYESSAPTIKIFCSICGSSLISLLKNNPEFIGLPIGGLDQDPGRRPEMHIFVGSKAPWYEITDNLPQYEEFPPAGAESVRTSK
ncbi:MAG: GFA family protein [Gammaproteobacteria bacterium]